MHCAATYCDTEVVNSVSASVCQCRCVICREVSCACHVTYIASSPLAFHCSARPREHDCPAVSKSQPPHRESFSKSQELRTWSASCMHSRAPAQRAATPYITAAHRPCLVLQVDAQRSHCDESGIQRRMPSAIKHLKAFESDKCCALHSHLLAAIGLSAFTKSQVRAELSATTTGLAVSVASRCASGPEPTFGMPSRWPPHGQNSSCGKEIAMDLAAMAAPAG